MGGLDAKERRMSMNESPQVVNANGHLCMVAQS
jgi:hypothetical protein